MTISMIDKAAEHIKERIASAPETGKTYLVAIDGRCASGKTTLAALLQKQIQDCYVVHMDHFFLREEQRTKERLEIPGGNVDHERVLADVLQPLKAGKAAQYRVYDCGKKALGESVRIMPGGVVIVEGSYSCHPALQSYYDLCIFLTTDKEEQMNRIQKRNGPTAAEIFRSKWIPLEEMYFSAYQINKRCDMQFET